MADKPGKPKIEVRQLKDLKPFPLQADYFDELSAAALKELADDIRRNGLRQPIQVLPKNQAGYPANTIIAGHQRKRALESLGKTEVEVLVRHDLADKGDAEIEKAFLEDNQNRRHLDRLAKARVALRLYEIKKKKQKGSLSGLDLINVRDAVGKQIGLSGRTLSRYFRVLKTPKAVQDAFQQARLSLVRAEKVADLDELRRRKLERRLEAGEDVVKVVDDLLPRPDGRHKEPHDALIAFVKSLEKGMKDLHGRTGDLGPKFLAYHAATMRQAKEVLDGLLRRIPKETKVSK